MDMGSFPPFSFFRLTDETRTLNLLLESQTCKATALIEGCTKCLLRSRKLAKRPGMSIIKLLAFPFHRSGQFKTERDSPRCQAYLLLVHDRLLRMEMFYGRHFFPQLSCSRK